jgi:small-conductance mechanosensitive channel
MIAVAAAIVVAGIALVRAQPQLPPATAAESAAPSAAPGLDAFKRALDEIESSLGSIGTEDDLVALKRRLTPVTEELRGRLAAIKSSRDKVDQRLRALPPDRGAEDAAATAERTRLATESADLDAAQMAASLLLRRAGDLDRRINDARHAAFADHMLARSASLFDAGYWHDLSEAAAAELRGLVELMALWVASLHNQGGAAGAAGAAAAAGALAALGATAWLAARRWRRLTAGPLSRRFDKAMAAFAILAGDTARLPATILATVLVLRNFGLMPDPIADIGLGLAVAAAASGFGRGVAAGLFAPGEAERRIIAFGDPEADSCAAHLVWGARAFAVAIFLNAVHRALGAPFAPMVATGELLALAILGIAIHFLWRSARTDLGEQAGGRSAGVSPALHGNGAGGAPALQGTGGGPAWLRALLWALAVALAAAFVTGYVGVAVFLAGRLVVTLAIAGAVTILLVFIDALTELVAADTPQGRRIAALFGLSPRGLELAEILFWAVLRLAVIVLAVLLVIGYSGAAVDVFGLIERASFERVIGVSLSPIAFLSALALLMIGGVAIRGAQRWLATQFLPRTGLDAGLQNSIAALFGYAALIAVIALALSALGIDLQKIALIAGALSVGIGFGLQSVVSNFVCGLILLAERPIRVGDWVVVRNEEGWVRRMGVRSTEIETFDRASVIIPNQEFITGMVKNWTHGNTMGRIIIKVRVAYDSDLAKVRETLLACATADSRVLGTPPPVVYLISFGDIGIDFELRCLLGNVEQALAIRSDLQTEVMRRFAEAGIRIPFPAHEARPPGPARGTTSPAAAPDHSPDR